MRKPRTSIVGLLALLLLLVTACGDDDSADATGADETADETTDGTDEPEEGADDEASAADGDAGTIAIITVDPSNPFWAAEVDTAVAEAEALGYSTTVNAHNNDPNEQNQFIDSAISAGVDAIILDPAGAEESVGVVQRATDAGIPVFLVNAEIAEQDIAKSQLVSNNAQGATLGAQEWAEAMGGEGTYVELLGNPTDNNARVRSDAYAEVLAQFPDLELLQQETANWDRVQGKERMDALLSAHPDLDGVVSGNDEMALGAIESLRDAGRLDDVLVLGFDGNQDAVDAVAAGEMVATVLQPIVELTAEAVRQADNYLRTGETGADTEKQAIDCMLITPENASQVNNFVVS